MWVVDKLCKTSIYLIVIRCVLLQINNSRKILFVLPKASNCEQYDTNSAVRILIHVFI